MQPTPAGEIPGIDREKVGRFFAEHVPGGDVDLDYEIVGAGRSNITYRVSGGVSGAGRRWALRRPPLGHVLPTAHDMAREHRVLSALADTDVPVPRPLALCEDPQVNGAPFYVMEFCDGVVLAGALPEGYADTEAERRRMCHALVDNLARLHAVDYRAVGLEGFGRPEGYLERQVRRWAKQWEGNRVGELPLVDELLGRLARALPAHSDATIVHGDYRLGNMALAPDDPGRVVAIFDWEMATLGDPLADLGYTLIYWFESGDPVPEGAAAHLPRWTALPGFLDRAGLVEAYATASGRDVTDVDFYQVLALTKLAVISEGIYKRFQMGKTVGKDFDKTVRATGGLAERALAIADASADPRLRG